jgi:hypothetical protein
MLLSFSFSLFVIAANPPAQTVHVQATSVEPRGVAGPAQAAYSAAAVKDTACGGAEA